MEYNVGINLGYLPGVILGIILVFHLGTVHGIKGFAYRRITGFTP